MKTILIALLVSVSSLGFSQKLTNQEIEKYLEGLKNEQILSEFGKDALYKVMTDEKGNFLSALTQNQTIAQRGRSMMPFPDSLSQSKHIILFYIGILDLMRNVGSSADELVQIREGVEKMLGEKMLFRNELDGDVNISNPLTFLQLSVNLKNSRQNYLQIILALKSLGLIDSKVEKELLNWIERDNLFFIKDFSPFIFAAKQSFFYGNYDFLKAEQISYVDSLKKVNLISNEDFNSLVNSYKPYELKSNIEILSKIKNVVLVDFNPLQTTRAEIYEKVFAEIKKKVLPNIKYKDLVLTETTKKAPENSYETLLSNSNQFFKLMNTFRNNTKYYQLSVQIDNQNYIQKSETDFTITQKIKDLIPPDIKIDSSIINTYLPLVQSFSGFGNNDLQVINDYLSDIHSEKRFIVASNGFNPFINQNDTRKAILLLDENQYKKVFQLSKRRYSFGPFNLGEKSNNEKEIALYNFKDSRDSLRKILYRFQSSNVIPQISASELDKIIVNTRLENSTHNFPRYLLKSYILPLKSMSSDKNDTQFFKNFINDLIVISDNKFNPEKPFDNFEKELKKDISETRVLEYGFRLDGKKFVNKSELYTINKDSPEGQNPEIVKLLSESTTPLSLVPEYIGLVNGALVSAEIDGQFYDLGDSKIIFLTKSQTEFLTAKYPSVFTEHITPANTDYYKEAVSSFDSKVLLNAMKREKLISEPKFEEAQNQKMKEPSDAFKFSDEVFVVDINDYYNKSNTEIYSDLLKKIGEKAFNGAKVSNVSVVSDTISEYAIDSVFLVSATINNVKYNQILQASLSQLIKSGVDSLKKAGAIYYPSIGENQFRIVNDYLNDINSKKRLVIVCDYQSPKLSFVFFDSTQATIVEESLPNNYVDFTMYDRQNSIDSLRFVLGELKNLGLFSEESNLDSLILEFRKVGGGQLNLLMKIPNLISHLNSWNFDLNADIVKNNLDELSRISRGQFKVENVTNNFKKMNKKSKFMRREYSYGFSFDGKRYAESQIIEAKAKSKNKEEVNEYLDFELQLNPFVGLCNKAITESGKDGAFYQLANFTGTDEIAYSVIYLTSKQHKYLNKKMPMIFAENYDYDDSDFDEKKTDK
ncbi:MAG: hypothetical protein MUF45_09100 [Spirosomaceae bacterium]|jgi:hypothetical protein|nr:hypothetical protein [Spirosomataceae bacterium]